MRPSQVNHVPELLARFDARRVNLRPMLEAIWDEYTYLPDDAAHQIAVKLGIPVAEVWVTVEKMREANRAPELVDL